MISLDDDLLSIMSCHLDSSPFVDLDEDVPIDVGKYIVMLFLYVLIRTSTILQLLRYAFG